MSDELGHIEFVKDDSFTAKPLITVHDFPHPLTTEALAHLLLIGYFDPPATEETMT